MEKEIKEIMSHFLENGEVTNIRVNNQGNINKTFFVDVLNNDKIVTYTLQEINVNVFKEPYKLMHNIKEVTGFIGKKLKKMHDTKHIYVHVIETIDHKPLYEYYDVLGNKHYYRLFNYIDNSISYDISKDENVIYNAAKGFGNFQKLLVDYPINDLEITIPDFHDTFKRYEKLLHDIELDVYNRCEDISKEILFFVKNRKYYNKINVMLGNEIPLRVTHNDTKINNVMLSKDTNEFVSVIDLDTIMPGSLLYDYGDGVRASASMTVEDDNNYDNVGINFKLFESFTKGFLEETYETLTEEEVSLLGDSILIITLELGIRFLDDYINGDTYFKINYSDHNLVRARNQICLAKDIMKKMDSINEFINNYVNELKRK